MLNSCGSTGLGVLRLLAVVCELVCAKIGYPNPFLRVCLRRVLLETTCDATLSLLFPFILDVELALSVVLKPNDNLIATVLVVAK